MCPTSSLQRGYDALSLPHWADGIDRTRDGHTVRAASSARAMQTTTDRSERPRQCGFRRVSPLAIRHRWRGLRFSPLRGGGDGLNAKGNGQGVMSQTGKGGGSQRCRTMTYQRRGNPVIDQKP